MKGLRPAIFAFVPALLLLGAGAPSGAEPPAVPAETSVTALLDAGRYEEALAAARRRLAEVEKAAGPDAPEVARAIGLVLKAGYWSAHPRDPGLLALARRAVAIDEKTSGPSSPETARSLTGLALILVARGEEDEVQALCERALAIEEKNPGASSEEAAQSHLCLGFVAEDRGDLHGALARYERALAIQEKVLGPGAPEVAATLNSLASVQRQLGDYPAAIESRKRCLAIREKAFGPDHPQVAWAIHNLGNLHADLGEFAEAKDLYERALAIRERTEPPDHPDLAYSHNSLGVVAYELGDYPAARSEYEEALAIREKALGPDHPLVAASLNNLGNLLEEMGELPEARDLLRRSLDIKTRKLGPDNPGTSSTANNLAEVLARMGAYAEAEDLYRGAMAAEEKALGPDHEEIGRVLDDLGWLRRLRGDPASGIPLLRRALAIRERTLGADHPDVAGTVERLAVATLEAGDPAAALPLARRALESQKKILGDDHPDVAASLSLIASIELRLGRIAEALDDALESERVGRDHFRLTARHLSQREALRFERVRASGLDVALRALAEHAGDEGISSRAGDVLDGVVRSRALVLDAIASRRRQAAESLGAEGARRSTAANEASTILARLVRRPPDPDHPERYRAQIREARERKERAERDLIEISPAEREWSAGATIGLAEVRRVLPEGAVLLTYARYAIDRPPGAPAEDGYVAFVTKEGSEGPPLAVPLGPASRIDALVSGWREEARRGAEAPSVSLRALEPRYREAASELREAIWDPIARRIQGATILLVVPDGAIDLVNLAALPAPGDRYLVETGPLIQYLSAERDLIAPERPRAAGSGLLLVGGVDYGAVPAGGGADVHGSKPPACSPFASLRFPPLPGAGAEADAVARIWKEHESGAVAASGEVMRLAGAEATAPAFLAAAPGKAILHLATHGFVLEDTCATASAAEAPEDPMLLSGLAFAGANRRRDAKPLADDGLLTAEEIAATDLSHAQWAVLSACDTGVGEVLGGEGVLGLRRAFEIAGAGTLIMSLWNVRDEDATEWMTALYRARFESLRTAEAVRRASIEVLESRRRNGRSTHPAAWGAFVASGEWR